MVLQGVMQSVVALDVIFIRELRQREQMKQLVVALSLHR